MSFFAKGANWVPPDSLHSKVTDGALCSYLESAVDAHYNFIRVWGGGNFPADAFFECADRLGVFIQQDGILSDAVYADTPSFVRKLGEEGQYQARRLASQGGGGSSRCAAARCRSRPSASAPRSAGGCPG